MNNSDINITPGKIIALWRILLVTHNHNGASTKDLYKAVLNSSVMGGDLPLKSGIQIGINYKFLIPRDNKLYVSDFSLEELISAHQSLEPSFFVLRKICFHIIKDKMVPWIIYFNQDVELFKVSIPNNWLEILEMADLLNFNDNEVLEWWHTIIKKKTEINDEKLKTIGLIGEKLTIDYEIDRILSDNITDAEKKVIWVSLISDDYGYDIISKSGIIFDRDGIEKNIYIEVKSSELTNPQFFTFYITENEFRKALEFGEKYLFYCWPGISIVGKSSLTMNPYIIPSKRITEIVPMNISPNCEWTKCRVSINLKEFSISEL